MIDCYVLLQHEYRVKWKGYGPASNEWVSASGMEYAADARDKYDRDHPFSLSPAETRYWPIELWSVKKLRHLIEGSPKTYVFTDYSAVIAIVKRVYIATTQSPLKANLRLVRAS